MLSLAGFTERKWAEDREQILAREMDHRAKNCWPSCVQWLKNGEVIAFAGGRQRLASATRDVSGLRMLDDNFYGVPQAVAIPLDRPDRLRLINAALVEMRSTGFLADSVARSGIEGLSVAPADR